MYRTTAQSTRQADILASSTDLERNDDATAATFGAPPHSTAHRHITMSDSHDSTSHDSSHDKTANKTDPHCHHDYQTSCSNCRLATICLPIALEATDIEKLDNIIQRGRPLRKGEHVYRENDPFTAVYAVRSGTLKGYSVTDDGEEQVTGFYFPGEIVGMDGISKNKHASGARALETSAICEIPFERLGELSARIPSLQRHFFQLMSQEIAEDQQLITMLSKNSAEQRVAALLLSISARNARRRLSATSFRLPMSRTDIGNYLGLTVETVSRVFGRFQKQDLLAVDNKEIIILNSALLRDTANGVMSAEA